MPCFSLRPVALCVASLWAASTSFSAEVVQAPAAPSGRDNTGQPGSPPPDAAPAPTSTTTTTTLKPIDVTAKRLRDARIELSPQVGTTVYSVTPAFIESLGKGAASSFDDVLLRLPGVSKDSKASGALHIRGDHSNVQYRIDGVQLPENISGFGSSIDTRFVERLDFITGALPAQYGLRTAGIIEIQTKQAAVAPGGRIGVTLGSHHTLEPSLELFGSRGNLSYYLSGSYVSNSNGIENPQPTRNPAHDETRQTRSFGSLSYFVDDDTRLGLLFGTYNGRFQIPTNPDQTAGFSLAGVSNIAAGVNSYPSTLVNERQREVNRFVAVSLQKKIGPLDVQASVFHQYSDLRFSPDAVGDLVFNGVASNTLRSITANGLQVDASYVLNAAHTLRFGTQFTRQKTVSQNAVSVFAVDSTGAQASDTPFTLIDNSGKTGRLSSLYAQDEWRLSPQLTVNYGARFDRVSAFTQEQQLSPRVNAAYQLSPGTAVHAGYSRYFTPPPQELASQQSIGLYAGTTNQPEVPTGNNVKAERAHYIDVGVSHQLTPELTLSADAYYKRIKNLLDDGQFGQALILSPFNYDKGNARGLEFSGTYTGKQWTGFLNVAFQKAQGTNIISGQSLFGANELAYIANHDVYLDHNQTVTLSGGLSYKMGATRLSSDFLYGSGLRRTASGGTPNGDSLPRYAVVNAAVSHTWTSSPTASVEARLALLNLFDKSYLLRDGSGIGVGAPQHGARRTLFAAISTRF